MSQTSWPAARVLNDLRGLFRGGLEFGRAARCVYSFDASPFALEPAGVAAPLDVADLVTLVEYAAANSWPLVPRGAGTGLAGESLGDGLIVDMSRHFRAVSAVGDDWVRVQAGLTLGELDAALGPSGRRLAVAGDTTDARTVGGLVMTNAAGPNAASVGGAVGMVRSLAAVLDTGEACEVGTPGKSAAWRGLVGEPERGPRLVELRALTAALLAEHRELIQLARPQTRHNRLGYALPEVLGAAGLDLVKLFAGSEGTLAVATEFTLSTEPRPASVSYLALGFESIDAAVLAGLSLWNAGPLARCELIDQRLLSRARAGADAPAGPVAALGAALLVSAESDSAGGAAAQLARIARDLAAKHGALMLHGPAEGGPTRGLIAAASDPWPSPVPGARLVTGLEDVAVPVEELPRFLRDWRTLLQKADVTALLRVQVLTGQVQTRPWVDLDRPAEREKLWALADAIHARAIALGGTVSAAHGTGLARSPWVEKQYGPLAAVQRELKRVYDPRGIFNPHKLTGPDPSRPAWPLRAVSARPARVPLLAWTAEELAAQVQNCNGCGACRTRVSSGEGDGPRMCPAFRAQGTEPAAPRAHANLMRAALGDPDPNALLSGFEARAVAATCTHCQMCRTDCPAGVAVPDLALEVKAAHFQEHGLGRTDWVMARLETFSVLGNKFALTANTVLGTRPGRWLAEALFGVSRRRTLPRFAYRSYLWRAWRSGLARRPEPLPPGVTRRRVIYFVDQFANYHDVTVATSAVALLKLAGCEVHVPWRQRASGYAPLVQGDLESARDVARYNVRTLAPLVRDGFEVVCSEPTAALALSQEYPRLLGTPDAKLVGAHARELTAYLLELTESGALPASAGRIDANLAHHTPCHLRALTGGAAPAAGPMLLAGIPGVQVFALEAGCSGMAGPRGLRADCYDESRRAGAGLAAELAKPRVIYGATECSSCRMQMQELSGKRTLHPAQYLALAHGLVPSLRNRLARPLRRRLTD